MPKGKKREATPKARNETPAAVDAPPAQPVGRPKGWKPSEHGANPGGRPVEWTEERIHALADKLMAWAKEHTSCYLETFCSENDTHPQRLSELAGKNDKFSEALKRAKASCAAHLAEATAGGEMPPAFGIFALKQHGWRDKQEVEHSGEVKGSGVIEIHLPAKRE